jgi:hypothetical protein
MACTCMHHTCAPGKKQKAMRANRAGAFSIHCIPNSSQRVIWATVFTWCDCCAIFKRWGLRFVVVVRARQQRYFGQRSIITAAARACDVQDAWQQMCHST